MARKTKKVSRKKLLKEPDEFISTTGKIIQFFRDHRRQVTLYGVIVSALVATGIGAYYYIRWQEGKAQAIQQQAFQLYQEALGKGAPTEGEKENYRKALEKFRDALSVHGWGNVAQVSRLYIGNCQYALEEYDQAIAAYGRCLDGPFRSLAIGGLGYCYEAKGDYAKALENFQKNAEEPGNPSQIEGMLAMARCHEKQNQKQKAQEVCQKALASHPNSPLANFIRWKISELKG